ncbi:hypothetical protein ACIG87_07800 [Micromonospora sp. NPDC051925]|uniref:hypothetical protein n=1 Tax=Micromonospora sp. NPDC051925 TaxID=3364288 RepID=UPI0037CB7B9A
MAGEQSHGGMLGGDGRMLGGDVVITGIGAATPPVPDTVGATVRGLPAPSPAAPGAHFVPSSLTSLPAGEMPARATPTNAFGFGGRNCVVVCTDTPSRGEPG